MDFGFMNLKCLETDDTGRQALGCFGGAREAQRTLRRVLSVRTSCLLPSDETITGVAACLSIDWSGRRAAGTLLEDIFNGSGNARGS